MQTLSDNSDPLGNSIHNKYSQARMSSDLHGLRAFKALILIHSILQEGPEAMADISPLRSWMVDLTHEAEWECDGKRGYAALVAGYVRFLTGRIKMLERIGLDCKWRSLSS